ncbi:MAG: acylphosphatase [Synergistaceae bacterium]|jgi:acylphosphatase|nr:acylphosphatase [Synergistaceae bacterium]
MPDAGEKLYRRRVVVAGKVQGVGFRWSSRTRASELGLTGWVRNLPERSVEICFQGELGAVDEMEDWCRAGSPWSRVLSVSVSQEAVLEGEKGFDIR